MMPASKHGDPQLGVDIHLCVVPPSPSPVPLPTPHTSIVFDPFDYLPYVGGTVDVCGMKRATAGTNGIAIHIPPGFPFAPKLPDKDDELFMGSSTVVADGDPFSFIAVPVLSCQIAGMMSPFRPKKKGGTKAMVLPTVFNLAIPTTVFVGGSPTISLIGMAFKGLFAALGKFAKSGLFKRMRQKLFGALNPGFLKCTILRAEPVNILTGAVSLEQEDFNLPGRIPIHWTRTYSSDNLRRGACGYGWETVVDTRLEVDSRDGSVTLRHPTLGPLFFAQLPVAEGEDGHELELMDGSRLTDHGDDLRVRTKDDRVYHFPKALASVSELGTTEYPIGRLADLCGNWLDFERRSGHISAINESAGRRVTLTRRDGRIVEVSLSAPELDTPHVFVAYEYDAAGDLIAEVDALGNPYRFAYDDHHMVRHTDRNGLSFYYAYDTTPTDGWRVVHSWGDGGLYDYRFEYGDLLKERRITDSLGNVSLIQLDEWGFPISEIDPLGHISTYEYDGVGRTTAVVDPEGRRTEYRYDDRGNLLELIQADTSTVISEFDGNGKAVAVTAPNGGRWQQQWDPRGLLLAQTSPLGNVSRYEYDGTGQLIGFVNPRGARTGVSSDRFGHLTRLDDALGRRHSFAVDMLGNVTAESDGLGHVTRYRYDPKSRLVGATLPSGATVSCVYDDEDNLIGYVDQHGARTRLEYFGQGEVARRIHPDGHSVSFHYDTEERLIAVTNQVGDIYTLRRDPLGRIVEETDYWGQSRQDRLDASGFKVSSTDPLGRTILFKTDPLGRVVEKILPDGFTETFAYDSTGNLVEARNAHGTVTREFDAENRLTRETQGTFSIRNAYDANGNRVVRETSSGNVVAYEHDQRDQLVAVRINQEAAVGIEWDPAGKITREDLGPGLRREFQYSADDDLTQQAVWTSSLAFTTHFDYDLTGNLTRRRDSQLGEDVYRYDPLGRITAHVDAEQRTTLYPNDPTGTRLRTRVVQRTRERVAGEGTVEVDWSREGEYAGTDYSFDRAGNLVYRRDARRTVHLRWNADQRLIKSEGNGIATRYGYDPLGRRLFKESRGIRTTFYWDGDVLVGESVDVPAPQPDRPDTAGTKDRIVPIADRRSPKPFAVHDSVREYVYYPETFVPLALIDRTREAVRLYYYHNDPNGSPTRLTDAAGTVVWAARYTAWGDVSRRYGDAVPNPIRLQGQYDDDETGLYYNRHRYFEPHVGAFVSVDPLGLDAGPNIYEYAANALVWTDPLGLKKCNIKKTAKAALGSAPAGIINPHMHHIVMEGAFSRWSKKNRSLITQARTILRKNNISIQGKQNVVWAQNAGHSVEYAEKVLAELKKADPLGRQAVVDALDDIGKKLGSGTF